MTDSSSTTTDFNPLVSPHREDPNEFYRGARARPVTLSPTIGAYIVARHDDLLTVLGDPTTFSSAAAIPHLYENPPEVVAELERRGFEETTAVVDEDGPLHEEQRRLYELSFSTGRVRAALPSIRAFAQGLVAGLPAGHANLVTDYAQPFARRMIEQVIGIPAGDSDKVAAWTAQNMLLLNPFVPVSDRVAAAAQMGDYHTYVQALIDARRAERRDDLISDLVHGVGDRPGLPDAQIRNIVRGARVAGHDTTRDGITAALLALLEHPHARARVAQEPDLAVPKIVEESLRRDAPHRGLSRVTTRDTELGGTSIPAGSRLLLLFGSGNRDEAMFPDPDDLDLDRPNVRAHLAFGQGRHRCPAAPLARAEIRIAVETLLEALPTLRLADNHTPQYSPSLYFRGLEELRVQW